MTDLELTEMFMVQDAVVKLLKEKLKEAKEENAELRKQLEIFVRLSDSVPDYKFLREFYRMKDKLASANEDTERLYKRLDYIMQNILPYYSEDDVNAMIAHEERIENSDGVTDNSK